MSAPIAPIAPNARLSTPVVRYSTTSPTPERAYTPPRARPVAMNGRNSSQLGIGFPGCSLLADQARVLRFDLLDPLDVRVDVGDLEAAFLLNHHAVLRGGGQVGVVRDVQRRVAVVPGGAEYVRP